jgi:hypothetical protein
MLPGLAWSRGAEMPFAFDSPPEPILCLLEWLDHGDFEIVEQQSSGSANQYARFKHGGCTVSVSRDRGEWSLSAGMDRMEEEFHPDEWEAWLDGFDLAGELSTLDHQVTFLIERWPEALEKAEADPGAEAEIRDIGRDYVSRRFGFQL